MQEPGQARTLAKKKVNLLRCDGSIGTSRLATHVVPSFVRPQKLLGDAQRQQNPPPPPPPLLRPLKCFRFDLLTDRESERHLAFVFQRSPPLQPKGISLEQSIHYVRTRVTIHWISDIVTTMGQVQNSHNIQYVTIPYNKRMIMR